MRDLFGGLRRRWRALWRPPEPPVPFDVACPCGQRLTGLRGARHRVARCGSCGEPVFILPRSPWPFVPDDEAGPVPARRRRPWLLPVLAAGLTLAAVVVGYVVLFTSLLHPPAPPKGLDTSRFAADQTRALAEARLQLRKRMVQQAWEVLEAARARHGRDPAFAQLHREAELLANLSPGSLEEIVERGKEVGDPDEWKKQFARLKYQGAGVLFDALVQRDPGGRVRLTNYEVAAGDEKVRLELSDLAVLRGLPLERPRRLFFGARLRSVAREEGAAWVVRFEPDSGVLVTDEEAVIACGLQEALPELRPVLRQQAEWLPRSR